MYSKNILYFLIIITSLLGLSSCMKDLQDDVKIDPIPIPEGIKVGGVELGPQYQNLVYYSLANNKAVKTNTLNDFDLSFECSQEGWHILLNSSRFMHAGNSGKKNFEEVTNPSGIEMHFDPSDGDLDSTAIGAWADFSGEIPIYLRQVYVIDLGLDQNGNQIGYRKVTFDSLTNNTYYIRYAFLDGTDDHLAELQKNSDYGFMGFSFDEGGKTVIHEPPKNDFDLFFGQYTTLLYSGTEPYPYLVRGVLTGRNGTKAVQYSGEKPFEEIELEDISGLSFPNNLDEIGHEWKYYNLEEGFYSVDSDMIFIIETIDGSLFKLHFMSYYNDDGETGYPQFEFMKVN